MYWTWNPGGLFNMENIILSVHMEYTVSFLQKSITLFPFIFISYSPITSHTNNIFKIIRPKCQRHLNSSSFPLSSSMNSTFSKKMNLAFHISLHLAILSLWKFSFGLLHCLYDISTSALLYSPRLIFISFDTCSQQRSLGMRS